MTRVDLCVSLAQTANIENVQVLAAPLTFLCLLEYFWHLSTRGIAMLLTFYEHIHWDVM